MARFFDEHAKRAVFSLDGTWKFRIDSADEGEALGWYKDSIGGESVTVPSVWNTDISLLEYEGVCWYEKSFLFEGGTLRLNFGAVMTYAKVYLDGEYLGEHYGGFCRFDFIKQGVARGYHRLTVRVDNRFDKKSIPQAMVDWYHYGGITRSVEAETLSGISILNNRFDYTLTNGGAKCRSTLELYNASNTELCDEVKIYIDGKECTKIKVTLSPAETKTVSTEEFFIDGVKLWSPGEPNLYSLSAESSTDDLYDRVGFRFVEVKGGKVLLNGEEIRFLGVNRHEENTDFGMAFPPALMKRDIDIITGANCNSIRGSHYPNNPIFLDMLDERGVMFWSEIPMWGVGFSTEALGDPDVVARGLAMHKEMVKEYYNHPSIIIWGMHNEINSDTKEAYALTKTYYEYLKADGGNRIVTYASDKPLIDICLEFCDIICINAYYGWYNLDVTWEEFLDEFNERKIKLGFADKLVIISEFGAAAIFGHHTFDNLLWTEEYQAKLISDCLTLFHAREEIVGSFIWQYSDIRTSKELGLNRARSYNNKGIVNEYRRPKLSYGAVRDTYGKIKDKR